MAPIIHLENVSAIYEGEKVAALRDVNLDVKAGEFIAIIGPNGAGKTTLLETINGLLRNTAGCVRVLGLDVTAHGDTIRKRVGYVPQDVAFSDDTPYLTKDVILMGRFGKIGLFRKPGHKDREKVDEVLDKVGIGELENRPVGKLSGGQQQKVMIARALAKEAEILLLDEPLSNLDFVAAAELLELICKLHTGLKLTTLMVIHDLSAIPEICSRVLLMAGGRLVAEAPPDEAICSEFLYPLYSSTGRFSGEVRPAG